MSDAPNLPVSDGTSQNNFDTVKLVYILYLVAFITGGIAALAGLIVAYLNREGALPAQASHYQFQIRTFWMGLAYLVVGTMLAVFIVGFFILFWYVIWVLVRSIKGFTLAADGKPVPDPTTWMW